MKRIVLSLVLLLVLEPVLRAQGDTGGVGIQPLTRGGTGAASAAQARKNLDVRTEVATVSALKAISVTGLSTGYVVATRGYYANGDAGGAVYYYDSASSATDDGGSVLAPAAGSGRWLLLRDGRPLTPEQFGAKGDATGVSGEGTDDTNALQKLLTAAVTLGRTVHLTRGYRITTALVLNGSCVVNGAPGHRIFYDGNGTYPYNHALVVESTVASTVEKPIAGEPAYNTTVVTMTGGEAAGYSVGDSVFVQYGVDKYDPNQPHYGYFTTVAAVGGSSITLTDGFPEASGIRRLRYSTASLSGGTFAEGDTITQGGASATITHPHPGSGGTSLLALSNVTGTFSAGTITNGTATATLVASFDSSVSVDAQYAVTVRKLSSIAENVVLQNLRIDHSFGGGVVGSGAICVNMARNVSLKNIYTPKNVVGVAAFYTHGLRIENLRCDELVTTGYALPAAIHGWNQVNTTIVNVDAVTDAALVNLESQCRNITITGLRGRRIGGGTGGDVLSIARGCLGVLFENSKLDQNVATQVLRDVPLDSSDTDIRYINFELRGPFAAATPLNRMEGTLSLDTGSGQKVFRALHRETRRLPLVPSASTTLQLPRGPYSRCRVYFSTDTGITAVSLVGTDDTENGQGENFTTLPPPTGGGWVRSSAFETASNANHGLSRKQLTITTDGALPSQSYVLVDFVAWNDDASEVSAFNLGLGTSDGGHAGSGSPVGLAVQPRFLMDRYYDYAADRFWFSNGTTGSTWWPVQKWDADLDTYASITPSANVQTLLGAANYAAFRTSLGLGTGDSPTFNGLTVSSSTTSGLLQLLNLKAAWSGSGTNAPAAAFNLSTPGEAAASKLGVGGVRDNSNGRGPLVFWNNDTNDTSAFTTSDEIARWYPAGKLGGQFRFGTATGSAFQGETVLFYNPSQPETGLQFIAGTGGGGLINFSQGGGVKLYTFTGVPGSETGANLGLSIDTSGNGAFGGTVTGTRLISTVSTGTAPLTVTSTTRVSNLNVATAGTADSAAALSISGQTGLLTFTGLTSTSRAKTIRDAADTILELGGSYTPTGTWTSMTLVTPALGTPASGNLANCTFPTLNQNTTGSAASLSISGQTGLLTFTGLTSVNRAKTVRDAADTLLELGGSYTPTGTWTNLVLTTPSIGGTATTGVTGTQKVVLDTSPTISGPTLTGTTAGANLTLSGKVTNYAGTATVGGGLPAQISTVDLTSQSGAVGATTLITPGADGWYRLSAILKITTTGTSPVAGPITITYNDGDGNVAQSQVMLLKNTSGAVVTTTVNNSTTTGTVNGDMVFYAKSGTAIQYAIAVSGTFGSGRYSAHLRLEAL